MRACRISFDLENAARDTSLGIRGKPMNKMRRQFLRLVGACIAAAATADTVRAQTSPARAVRVIVTAAPGGPSDVIGRIIAQKLSETWSQPFVVENMPAGAGNVAV